MIGIAGAVAWQVVMRYEPLYNRFFEGDDAFVVGDLKLNTSGRMAFWERLWESAFVDPWFGRGIGSSVTVTSRYYAEFGTDQPHNDYLRLFHDLGYIGVTLFVVTWIALIVGASRRAARSTDATTKQVHIAAALALAMVAVAAITDNMIIYPFIMVPVGVLVRHPLPMFVPARRSSIDLGSAPQRTKSTIVVAAGIAVALLMLWLAQGDDYACRQVDHFGDVTEQNAAEYRELVVSCDPTTVLDD